MIEVKINLPQFQAGNSFAQGLIMKNINENAQEIKKKLLETKCPNLHEPKAKVIIHFNNSTQMTRTIEDCCCEDFKNLLTSLDE